MTEKDKEIAQNESLDTVLRLMEGDRTLTDTRIEEMRGNEEACRLFNDFQDCKQAMCEKLALRSPDVAEEWNKFVTDNDLDWDTMAGQEASSSPNTIKVSFMQRHRQLLAGCFIGIAATLLCLFLFTWYQHFDEMRLPEGMVVFEAKDTPQIVTLKSGDDEALAIDANRSSAEMPALIASKNGPKLNYQKAADKRPPIIQLLTTPIGKDFQVTLSDGTQVYLSADSRLVYPSRFEGKERMVALEGEAYFDVARDNEHPFIVKTEHLGVKVIGTKFNISNYVGKLTRVTLIEGSVNVTNPKGGKSLLMKPSDEVTIDSNGTVTKNTIDVDGYVYWQEGFFYFDNQPLSEIMQTIGKWYNVSVVFVNEAAMNYRFHFLCERKADIQHAIELLNRMKNLDITLQGTTVVIR